MEGRGGGFRAPFAAYTGGLVVGENVEDVEEGADLESGGCGGRYSGRDMMNGIAEKIPTRQTREQRKSRRRRHRR